MFPDYMKQINEKKKQAEFPQIQILCEVYKKKPTTYNINDLSHLLSKRTAGAISPSQTRYSLFFSLSVF